MYNTLTYFQVNVYEEDLSKWPADRRILIIYFSDQANAVRWLNSDKYFKNDDFPQPSDTLQIFLIPVHYTADKGTVHWPISQLYTLYLAATHYLPKEYNCIKKTLKRLGYGKKLGFK